VATRAVGEVDGLLGDPAPSVRFIPGFGDFSLNFTLSCQVREFVDQYSVQHELRKRIFARFKQEGIEIPFPIRTVHLVTDGSMAGSKHSLARKMGTAAGLEIHGGQQISGESP
jgi:small-conductance mechanosensitive channel